jgi:hypothetical protein
MARKTTSLDLKELANDAVEQVAEAKQTSVILPEEEARVALTPREITFTLAYDAPDGKDYSADITSKVMDSDGRLAKARVISQLTRGINPDTLGNEDRYRVEALARMAIQLIEPPKWVYDLTGQDTELLVHVNNILMEHENRYFRGNSRKGEAGEIKARVRSSVSAFDATDT